MTERTTEKLNATCRLAYARLMGLPVSMREDLQRVYTRTVSILALVADGIVDIRPGGFGRILSFVRELDRADKALSDRSGV